MEFSVQVFLSDASRARLEPVGPQELASRGRRGGLEGRLYKQLWALVSDPVNRLLVENGTPAEYVACPRSI